MTTSSIASKPTAPTVEIAGLPADLVARSFDPAGDYPAAIALIWAVSTFDHNEEFPSAEELAGYWRTDRGFDATRDVLVIADSARFVGMAYVTWSERSGKIVHWIEVWVHPERRREGIGRALVAWGERHAADQVAASTGGPVELPHFLALGVMQENAAAMAFAPAMGYVPNRFGHMMRRDLTEPIPDLPLPDGIDVRPVLPEHHRAIWLADIEAFEDHFEPRVRTEEDFVSTYTGPNVDTSLWRVAWDGAEVVGSVQNQINPTESERLGIELGWLEHVSVRRAWRGRGVASALIADSLRALRDRGMSIATLGVDALNPTGALGVYERLGFYRYVTWVAHRKPLEIELSKEAGVTLRAVDYPAELPAIVDLLTTINRHDLPGWFPTIASLENDWTPSSAFDPARDLQALAVDGVLVGLSRVTWRERPAIVNHRLEVYIHPDHRRRGLGTHLLDWAEARARASAGDGSGGPATKPHQFGGAGSDRSGGMAPFAAQHGYAPFRYHFDMRRPLADPILAVPLPDGIDVRPAKPEHYRAIFAADEEAFRDHWDAAEPVDGDFERWIGDPDLDPSLWQIAWDGDEVAGLVINGIYRHENEQSGEQVGWLDSVATRRPWRRRSLAGALIARSLAVLRERGMEIAELGVDAENPTGALQVYERHGFRQHSRWTFYRKPF